MKHRRLTRQHAFTLLEIMLVVAIIALLLGSGFYIFGNKLAIGQDMKVRADIVALGQSLQTYRMVADDQLPTTDQGLQALVTLPQSDPKPNKWYQMMEKLPKDPWGHEYVYVYPGKHNPNGYDLYSKGKDGVADTADDQGNWDDKK